MYDPIMLTLDGSELSESALPHAVSLAKAYGSRLLILRVVPPVIHPFEVDYGVGSPYGYEKILEAETQAANDYLSAKVNEVQAQGVTAEALGPFGEPASAILDTAEQRGVQLIVMATHGRSGIGRFVFGSVADRVLRSAEVPVLLVRVRGAEKSE